MLTRYFEQRSDTVHVLRGQRQIAPEGATQEYIQVRNCGGPVLGGYSRIKAHWFHGNCLNAAPSPKSRSHCDHNSCNPAQQ
jgi:hypothetical protein